MRPGHLGNTTYWFDKNLAGEWFEVEEVYSADPIYSYKWGTRGKTGQEFKTKINTRSWSSLLIPRKPLADKYKLSPYGRQLRIIQLLPVEWRHPIL